MRRPALRVTLIALLVIVGQWVDTRLQISGMQQEVARRLAEGDNLAREGRTLARQSQETVATLQAKVNLLDARLAEIQGQSLALQAMYQEMSGRRDERLLAEVEQAIALAMQQLQFAGNVEVALMALEDAEARLAREAQAQLVPLRRLLIRDIARLKATPGADITGLSLKIESVSAAADTLLLAFEQRPATGAVAPPTPVASPARSTYWRALLADLWNEFHQLVRIERIEQRNPALLSPSQSFFLRENLKLRLLNARLALLQRDGKTFREEIRQAQELLDRYFDVRTRPVAAARATLKTLAATDVGFNLPSLSETLAAVRNLKLARERGAGR